MSLIVSGFGFGATDYLQLAKSFEKVKVDLENHLIKIYCVPFDIFSDGSCFTFLIIL